MLTRAMLCFGYRPMDLQAFYTAEDRQGSCYKELAPYLSQVPGLGFSTADWTCSRGGFVIARARSSRGHLCAVPWVGSAPGKSMP